jgi:hypothetical protein
MLKRAFFCCWLRVLLVLVGACFGAILAIALLVPGGVQTLLAQTPKPLAMPPAGQQFVGTKECASCHLDQYLTWRESKHAKGFEILPAKYRSDSSCLKCHSTGHGEDTGFKSLEETPNLGGTSCESCHGPGSKHGEIAKTYANKKLTKEEEAYVRSTIHRMQPKNVCVDCHQSRGHKKHPPYDK